MKSTKIGNKLTYSLCLFLFSVVQLIFIGGCTGTGNLRFNPLPSTQEYNLSGKILLPEIVENDLLVSTRSNLETTTDFSKFKVFTDNSSVSASADGSFSLQKIPFINNLVLEAKAGKVILLLRVYPTDLSYTNTSQLSISIKSTVEALIWKYGVEFGKELTQADITAREYSPEIASLTMAIKLALQLNPTNAGDAILELPMVTAPARYAANKIEAREEILRDANAVFKNILLRKDLAILKTYISPSFSNDWDSSSNWDDLITAFEKYFNEYNFITVAWDIEQIEMLPLNMARVRIKAKSTMKHILSEQLSDTQDYVFDSIWRKEGSFWKVYRNLPYKKTHPTQVGADARWGEIADIHRQLQAAIAIEDISVLEKYISPVFGNDWDVTSTYSDIISTAKSRFNSMDVKIATYSIDAVEFVGPDLARVHCSSQVSVINLALGIDINSGPIKAIIDWRREDGVWKIFRNLPYRFHHRVN